MVQSGPVYSPQIHNRCILRWLLFPESIIRNKVSTKPCVIRHIQDDDQWTNVGQPMQWYWRRHIYECKVCVSVGGKLKKVDEEMDVLRKTSEYRGKLLSASSVSQSQSQSLESPSAITMSLECDRLKELSLSAALGPTTITSPSA